MFQLIKTFGMLAVAGLAFGFSWITAGQDREDMIAYYELSSEEAEAYDSCKSALSGYELKNGGSETEFCGCYAKKGTERLAAGHKKLSARYIEAAAEKKVEKMFEPLPDGATVDGVSSIDAATGMMDAFSQCVAAVDYSCRSGDEACKETVRERKAQREERMKTVRAARERGEATSGASTEAESAATTEEINASTAETVKPAADGNAADASGEDAAAMEAAHAAARTAADAARAAADAAASGEARPTTASDAAHPAAGGSAADASGPAAAAGDFGHLLPTP